MLAPKKAYLSVSILFVLLSSGVLGCVGDLVPRDARARPVPARSDCGQHGDELHDRIDQLSHRDRTGNQIEVDLHEDEEVRQG